MSNPVSLDLQRAEFSKSKFIAMPIAGLIAWLVIGIAALFLPLRETVWVLFIATGSIAYLGMFISKFTGEDFLDKTKPKNAFDQLFMSCVGMSIMVYSIAIPFFLIEPTSLPLTVGILTGLMWFPFSWIIQHWVGVFHTAFRTSSIVALWYLFPDDRFVVIPFAIVFIYLVTIFILNRRKVELE